MVKILETGYIGPINFGGCDLHGNIFISVSFVKKIISDHIYVEYNEKSIFDEKKIK